MRFSSKRDTIFIQKAYDFHPKGIRLIERTHHLGIAFFILSLEEQREIIEILNRIEGNRNREKFLIEV